MSVSFWMLIHMLRTSGIRKKSAQKDAFTSSGMIFLWLAVTPTTNCVCYLYCSSFAPEEFIRSLEIDTSDQQVNHVFQFVFTCVHGVQCKMLIYIL